MFLQVFSKHRYSRGKAVAASHVPPTQRVIVTSRIGPAYAFVTSQNITICHAPFSFILFYLLLLLLFYFISDVPISNLQTASQERIGVVLDSLSKASESLGGYTTVFDARPVRRQAYGYLPGRTAVPLSRY